MVKQAVESFDATDKQREMKGRVRQSVQRGMVEILNVGYPEGKGIYYPKHQINIKMPAPGETFLVPEDAAQYLMAMPTRKKLQMVHGSQPSNFTAPPGFKLVPVEPAELEVDAEDMLTEEVSSDEDEVVGEILAEEDILEEE